MADQYELAEQRRGVANRIGGFYNSFRYAANRALWILPHLSVGKQFRDTLGVFYPFSVSTTGALTFNNSVVSGVSTGGYLTFHNSQVSVTDILMGNNVDGSNNPQVYLAPNSGSSKVWELVLGDRTGTNYTGLILFPSTTLIESYGAGGAGNINLDLRAQNSGVVILGAQLANYLGVTGVASGSQPFIQSYGSSDSNVDILLQTKGSGVLALGYSFTTLGGGAAPTFGTIGGSGPTSAGQAAWVKIKSGTTSYWAPVWT